MERKKKRGWIWLIIIAVLIGGGVFVWRYFDGVAVKAKEAADAALTSTYTVERGNIDTLVTASGSLAAQSTYSVNIPDALLVNKILVSVGDYVQKGDPIAQLDPAVVQQELIALRGSIAKEEGSLKSAGKIDSIKCPATGRLVYQPVLPGDDVLDAMNKYGLLCIISTDGFMRLTISTSELLPLGGSMRVKWDGGSATGTVDRATPDGYVLLIPDSHIPYQAFATVVGDNGDVGSGTVEVNMPIEVYGYDGVIRSCGYVVGESVADGKELFELRDAPVSLLFASHYASDILLSKPYKKLISYVINPVITAPEDGVIAEMTLKEGALSGTTTNPGHESPAYRLSAGKRMVMTVDVDELDILKLSAGQHASVTLEALPDESLSGEVTRLSRIGKKNNSVSVFAVEITMDPDDRLLSGMNGSATIEIDRAENVLVIPIAAILEDGDGVYVNRLMDGGSTVRVSITTGRSNEDFAEVTGGLSEGDVISYAVVGDVNFMTMDTSVTVSTTEAAGTADGEG